MGLIDFFDNKNSMSTVTLLKWRNIIKALNFRDYKAKFGVAIYKSNMPFYDGNYLIIELDHKNSTMCCCTINEISDEPIKKSRITFIDQSFTKEHDMKVAFIEALFRELI